MDIVRNRLTRYQLLTANYYLTTWNIRMYYLYLFASGSTATCRSLPTKMTLGSVNKQRKRSVVYGRVPSSANNFRITIGVGSVFFSLFLSSTVEMSASKLLLLRSLCWIPLIVLVRQTLSPSWMLYNNIHFIRFHRYHCPKLLALAKI